MTIFSPFFFLLFFFLSLPFFGWWWWWRGIAARYLWNAARCQCMPHFDKCKCTLIADAINTNSSYVSAIHGHSVIITNKTIAGQIGVNGTLRRCLVFSNGPPCASVDVCVVQSARHYHISSSSYSTGLYKCYSSERHANNHNNFNGRPLYCSL